MFTVCLGCESEPETGTHCPSGISTQLLIVPLVVILLMSPVGTSRQLMTAPVRVFDGDR
jgi:hypothetical protein